jgi:hypothetical protein
MLHPNLPGVGERKHGNPGWTADSSAEIWTQSLSKFNFGWIQCSYLWGLKMETVCSFETLVFYTLGYTSLHATRNSLKFQNRMKFVIILKTCIIS